jgi:hypothetical protein
MPSDGFSLSSARPSRERAHGEIEADVAWARVDTTSHHALPDVMANCVPAVVGIASAWPSCVRASTHASVAS